MSDHFSGPMVMGDPSVDITDFYAFPSPERPGNVVLIMDVFPMATAQSCFSDVVTHRFRLRPLTRLADSIVAVPDLQGWSEGSGSNFGTTIERWHFADPSVAARQPAAASAVR